MNQNVDVAGRVAWVAVNTVRSLSSLVSRDRWA
jgi:hypothetical protein